VTVVSVLSWADDLTSSLTPPQHTNGSAKYRCVWDACPQLLVNAAPRIGGTLVITNINQAPATTSIPTLHTPAATAAAAWLHGGGRAGKVGNSTWNRRVGGKGGAPCVLRVTKTNTGKAEQAPLSLPKRRIHLALRKHKPLVEWESRLAETARRFLFALNSSLYPTPLLPHALAPATRDISGAVWAARLSSRASCAQGRHVCFCADILPFCFHLLKRRVLRTLARHLLLFRCLPAEGCHALLLPTWTEIKCQV